MEEMGSFCNEARSQCDILQVKTLDALPVIQNLKIFQIAFEIPYKTPIHKNKLCGWLVTNYRVLLSGILFN